MGCFSYKCQICGKGMNSSSFNGENVRLSLLQDGRVIEEMQGAYDSYGRVFSEEKRPNDRIQTMTSPFEWLEDWNKIVDMQFGANRKSGICAVHVACIPTEGFVPVVRSKDDPNQGWGMIRPQHTETVKVYHKVNNIS